MISDRRYVFEKLIELFEIFKLEVNDEHDNFTSIYSFKPFRISVTASTISLYDYCEDFNGCEINNRIKVWIDLTSFDNTKKCLSEIEDYLSIFYKRGSTFKKFYSNQFQ